jgi:hypothetical protein
MASMVSLQIRFFNNIAPSPSFKRLLIALDLIGKATTTLRQLTFPQHNKIVLRNEESKLIKTAGTVIVDRFNPEYTPGVVAMGQPGYPPQQFAQHVKTRYY